MKSINIYHIPTKCHTLCLELHGEQDKVLAYKYKLRGVHVLRAESGGRDTPRPSWVFLLERLEGVGKGTGWLERVHFHFYKLNYLGF